MCQDEGLNLSVVPLPGIVDQEGDEKNEKKIGHGYLLRRAASSAIVFFS